MDASLLSTRSVEMYRIEVSRRMVTVWVAGMWVITPLAMPSSLSLFPRDAKSRINGGTSVPHDDFRVNPGYPAGEASLYLQSVPAQLLKPCENAVNNTVAAGTQDTLKVTSIKLL